MDANSTGESIQRGILGTPQRPIRSMFCKEFVKLFHKLGQQKTSEWLSINAKEIALKKARSKNKTVFRLKR